MSYKKQMLRDFKNEKFDIIIQAGQSNAEGCGLGTATTPFLPNDNIWYFNGDFSISMAQERTAWNEIIGDFSLSFASEYIEKGLLKDGRKLLILRTAIGGTGFSDKRWGMEDDLFLRMMEMIKTALALNPDNKLVAFLWHQGETDAILNATYEMHYENLSNLVNAVRSTFGYPNLPFVAADFVDHWKKDNLVVCEPVVKAISDLCATIGNAKFFETSELLSNDKKVGNGDTIHFCRESLNQLGVEYFKGFSAI